MNKKFVYQVGNNKKVIVWCTANQISRKGNSSLTQANLEHKAKNIYIKEVMYWPKRVEGRDSSVVITTRYGLDGPGIESRWWVIFFAPVQTSRGAHPASYTVGIGSFPGVKRPGRGVDYPPPSSATVKEKVELYLYSPFGPSWPVLGWNLPLPLPKRVGRSHSSKRVV